ncbi:MAG: M1 family aminopeptidase [Sediminibacterium sp.]
MKKIIVFSFLILGFLTKPFAQAVQTTEDTSWQSNYRAFATKSTDLVHTKLVANFDYQKSQMNGEVWIKLRPHFYPSNSLVLDAKGMDINQVALVVNNNKKKLAYNYDGLLLNIFLDKTYKATDQYTVYIKYTAKPNDYKAAGSAAITDVKGLYFINPLGKDSTKPTQIWTQGETEGTSVWIPTIDNPNQKTTQEFHLTVPSKYVSLSNGLLVKQVDNKNGTRLDIWKMDLPHSPYLFFIGIGDYAVIKDSYKGKEVSYYIEKAFEKEARKIYGKTPAMIAHFEKVTGTPYPWAKYAQISGQDYVSGAMENTTSTLHGSGVQQTARELVDGNSWEGTIAHELFHQWFGDLVTAESWSNLTVNESFADYGQTLWLEKSEGKDAADFENFTGLKNYLSSPADSEKDLVRFFYKDEMDMFDLVSYQKGGRILHMLRNYVGEEAFTASLKKYLADNKFSTGSAIKLKLAFEATTGKDLNWFFNQWYFGNGHPYVRITHQYLTEKKQVLVKIQQTQIQDKVFTLPLGIDVYVNGIRNHYDVWSKNRVDSFYFPADIAPDNVNVDNDKILLWAKDETKPMSQYIYQYYHARNFLDRYEAAKEAIENIKDPKSFSLIRSALKDSFHIIRTLAINSMNPLAMDTIMENAIVDIASKDPITSVREKAIDVMSALKKEKYKQQFIAWTRDSSYLVAGAALEALEKIDSLAATAIAKEEAKNDTKKRLSTAVMVILSKYGDESVFDFIANKYALLNMQSAEKFGMTALFSQLLINTNDPVKFKKGIDLIVEFRESIPSSYRSQTDPYFNGKILGALLKAKKTKGQETLVKMVSDQLPKP